MHHFASEGYASALDYMFGKFEPTTSESTCCRKIHVAATSDIKLLVPSTVQGPTAHLVFCKVAAIRVLAYIDAMAVCIFSVHMWITVQEQPRVSFEIQMYLHEQNPRSENIWMMEA